MLDFHHHLSLVRKLRSKRGSAPTGIYTPQHQSLFFSRLPLEIRNEIYRLLLLEDTFIGGRAVPAAWHKSRHTRAKREVDRVWEETGGWATPTVAQVCRRMKEEALELYTLESKFRIRRCAVSCQPMGFRILKLFPALWGPEPKFRDVKMTIGVCSRTSEEGARLPARDLSVRIRPAAKGSGSWSGFEVEFTARGHNAEFNAIFGKPEEEPEFAWVFADLLEERKRGLTEEEISEVGERAFKRGEDDGG